MRTCVCVCAEKTRCGCVSTMELKPATKLNGESRTGKTNHKKWNIGNEIERIERTKQNTGWRDGWLVGCSAGWLVG